MPHLDREIAAQGCFVKVSRLKRGKMTEKIRILDADGTALEVTLEEGGFLRFITDADKLPQGKGVWLDAKGVVHLILQLAGLLSEITKSSQSATQEEN